jgi:DNA polymerase epsilon subunit 1
MVTYNGDFFDMPFVEKRATVNGLDMEKEIGISVNKAGEYDGRFMVHLDAFYWVKRDSYLPQGSQGLKAVTKAKLKYNPQELDPEDMLPFAASKPQVLASYSVSDAVATYYLYQKYVHSFIYSLCNIIPLAPKDVLRKGSGTLCEVLLMVKAFEGRIVFPNKQKEAHTKFHNNHLLESETYIGGHVECLESGVFREDFDYDFNLNPPMFEKLIGDLDATLKFAIVEEAGLKMEDVVNYDEVRDIIKGMLENLRDKPNFKSEPLIYHLDVGAMYPNIILTNRLQPMACVDEGVCAACDFNRPGKSCQLDMEWKWRGKHFPASRNEYEVLKTQMETETVKIEDEGGGDGRKHARRVDFTSLRHDEQATRLKKRVGIYSQKVYKKTTIETVETKKSIICQRENPFYVNTVKAFRDRRYYYKAQNKKAGIAVKEATTAIELQKAKDLQLLFDSLQLAHKCILNSFYGYVMRKGARWRSIEMAGVVTHTGANIIKDARVVVEQIGRALELDTDGIWAILPKTFPEEYNLQVCVCVCVCECVCVCVCVYVCV